MLGVKASGALVVLVWVESMFEESIESAEGSGSIWTYIMLC